MIGKLIYLFVVLSLYLFTQLSAYAGTHPIYHYANGRVLQDQNGQIYYHDGKSLMIDRSSGNMYYAPWQVGKPRLDQRRFRYDKGLFSRKIVYFYPNGQPLVEWQYYVYYPRPNAQAPRRSLTEGVYYKFSTGVEFARTGYMYESKYSNGWWALKGKQLYDQQGNLTEGPIWLHDHMGDYGYVGGNFRAQL